VSISDFKADLSTQQDDNSYGFTFKAHYLDEIVVDIKGNSTCFPLRNCETCPPLAPQVKPCHDAYLEYTALIMFHFKVDIDKVSEDDFCKYVGWLRFALEKNGQWQ